MLSEVTVSTRDGGLCCQRSHCTRSSEDSSGTNGIWYGILKISLAVKQQIFNFETVHLTLLCVRPPPAVEFGGYSSGSSGRPIAEVACGWLWPMGGSSS